MSWMTTGEAAERARRHRNTILLALRSGELVGYQRTAPQGAWRIKESDLDKWLRGE
ncbi:helix-turn-helix domain-containing protein [Rhodococcus hoagii]|nr:helix-turn-helix domain-containing protein [Prescottella equi]